MRPYGSVMRGKTREVVEQEKHLQGTAPMLCFHILLVDLEHGMKHCIPYGLANAYFRGKIGLT